MIKLRIQFILIILLLISTHTSADDKILTIEHNNTPQTVLYDLYIDPEIDSQNLPVLICIGGLYLVDGVYSHSSTQECRTSLWLEFARTNKMAILGIGFKFDPEDWETKSSYQYAQIWSGKAVNDILNQLAKAHPIDTQNLYLYGVSAGAQFSIRYAHLYPETVKAVTAHAAGGFDYPKKYIPTHFLLTVGDLDNVETKRRDSAIAYEKLLKEKGIEVELKIIPEIGHVQTEEQNRMSREFIKNTLKHVY